MKTFKILMIFGLLLFVASCTDYCMICSLNPFYTEKYITLMPEVEGTWKATPIYSPKDSTDKVNVWEEVDTTSAWNIERYISRETKKDVHGKDSIVFNPMNHYMVKLSSFSPDTSEYKFKMVLFRVKGVLYADFMPEGNAIMNRSRFFEENHFPVHTLARIKLEAGTLKFSWLGAEYMKEMIEKKRVRISYRWIEKSKRLLLTGTSEQLINMIDRYAGQPRFIDWENQQAMLKLNAQNQ